MGGVVCAVVVTVTGDWQSYFSEEQSRRLDELYEKELGGSGLVFKYFAD